MSIKALRPKLGQTWILVCLTFSTFRSLYFCEILKRNNWKWWGDWSYCSYEQLGYTERKWIVSFNQFLSNGFGIFNVDSKNISLSLSANFYEQIINWLTIVALWEAQNFWVFEKPQNWYVTFKGYFKNLKEIWNTFLRKKCVSLTILVNRLKI